MALTPRFFWKGKHTMDWKYPSQSLAATVHEANKIMLKQQEEERSRLDLTEDDLDFLAEVGIDSFE
jgi:hypothetical protein